MDPEASTVTDAEAVMQSPSVGKLASALALAQGEMKAPGKGREAKIESAKGGYSYKYADLADVIDSYRTALSKHSLAVVQTIHERNGHLILTTKLLHGESGEWIASEYPLRVYERPQEQGSAITYARRYAVTSLLGIAAEDDDDGKRAQEAEPARTEAPISGDAAAIIHLADAIAQINGTLDYQSIIVEASKFTGKDGKEVSFSDPTTVRSVKWLKGVRAKLEKEAQIKGALAALGEETVPF